MDIKTEAVAPWPPASLPTVTGLSLDLNGCNNTDGMWRRLYRNLWCRDFTLSVEQLMVLKVKLHLTESATVAEVASSQCDDYVTDKGHGSNSSCIN